jgi:hypothetical protein
VEYTIDFREGGAAEDVLVETSGRGSLRGFTAFLDELVADSRYRPGFAVLIDHSALDPTELVTADARVLAEMVADMGERVHGTAIVCVAPRPAMYGISRAFELYSETSGVRARVFATVEDARAWLAEAKRADESA